MLMNQLRQKYDGHVEMQLLCFVVLGYKISHASIDLCIVQSIEKELDEERCNFYVVLLRRIGRNTIKTIDSI